MRILSLACLIMMRLALGFQAVPSISQKLIKQQSTSKGPSDARTKPRASTSTTALAVTPVVFVNPELIVPAMMILGGAAATILNEQEGGIAASLPSKLSPATAEDEDEEEEPAPTPVVATIPVPAPAPEKPAMKEEVPLIQMERSSTPEPATDAEAEDTTTKEMTAGDSIAELRRGVAKTLDDSSKVPSTQLLQRSTPSSAPEEAAAEDTEEEEETSTPNKRSFLRKIWRVIKKVVAPWRKWENIS